MRVDVFNREQAEVREPTPGTVIISISSPGCPANLKDGWEDVLRLEFHDVVKPVTGIPELVLFSVAHVEQIHDFVEHNLDKDFVVHCDAGVSRSVAVGVFLRDVYDAELHTHAIHTTDGANSRVLRGLKRKHWQKQLTPEE